MASQEDALSVVLKALGCDDERGIASALGMSDDDQQPAIYVTEDWHRGGAETYVLVFELRTRRYARKFIVKACTPFSPAISIDRVLGRWLTRRRTIEECGCAVPRLYAARSGTLIEDYIEYELGMFPRFAWTPTMTKDLLHFADVLLRKRFSAVTPFADLRTDGHRVYVIDFGEELGDSNATLSPPDYRLQALCWAESNGILLEA